MPNPEEFPPGVASNPAASFQPQSTPLAGSSNLSFESAPNVLLTLLTYLADGFLSQARDAARRGDDAFAVILAHVACEVETELSLRILIETRGDKVLGPLVAATVRHRPKHLRENSVYDIYRALTGDYLKGDDERGVKRVPWWDRWVTFNDLRDTVVHKGAKPSPEQSAEGIEVALAYVTHMRTTTSTVANTINVRP